MVVLKTWCRPNPAFPSSSPKKQQQTPHDFEDFSSNECFLLVIHIAVFLGIHWGEIRAKHQAEFGTSLGQLIAPPQGIHGD